MDITHPLVQTFQIQRLIVTLHVSHVWSDFLMPLLDTLHEAGIRCLQVPPHGPDTLLERLRRDGVWVWGVGPVTTPEQLDSPWVSEAHFVTLAYSHPAWPDWMAQEHPPVLWTGATLSECAEGIRLGAIAVRLFPVSGWDAVRWITQVRKYFPAWSLIPAGGVNFTNARRFLELGVLALEVDDTLLEPHLIQERNWSALHHHVREWLRHIQGFQTIA
jgi:2-dehydro-3-deoxyphosphogluconate aldolase/(4S)-4-hydroxy-2-oxoglutarate aldolase